MKRVILPVILGYLVIAGVVMLAFAPANIWPELPFHPGTTRATLGWSVYTLILGILGAIGGGVVAARLAGDSRRMAVRVLAALALVMGAYSVISQHVVADGAARLREPLWYSLALVVAGPAAVLRGGSLRLARRGETAVR